MNKIFRKLIIFFKVKSMRAFKNIKKTENIKITQSQNFVVFTYKKLKLLSFIFCCVLSLNILGLSYDGLGISEQIKRMTSSWTPNLTDIGKLKFVNTESEYDKEVVSEIEEFTLPFENVFVTETSSGEFNVNGLGSMVVKSCYDGRVEKIDVVDGKKCITIQHKRGLKSVYEKLDNVSVKVGDIVKKNSAIGISESSVIVFKIYFKNKLITGLSFENGEMVFL